MLVHRLTIPDVTQNVHKPIVLSIIKDMIRFGIFPRPDKNVYNEVTKKPKQPSRDQIGYVTDRVPYLNKLSGDDILTTDVTRENLENPGYTIMNGHYVGEPLLWDKKLDFTLIPMYDIRTYNLNFRYYTSDIYKAQEIADKIRNYFYIGQDSFLHDVEFSIAAPDVANDVVMMIHSFREKRAPYGDTVQEYYRKIAHPSMIVASDIEKKNFQLRWVMKHLQVEGRFQNPAPEVNEVSDGVYVVENEYKITVNEPLMLTLTFPIIVHNNLLPREIVMPRARLESTVGKTAIAEPDNAYLDNTQMLMKPDHTRYPVIVPQADKHRVEHNVYGYMPIAQVLAVINPDKHRILDLHSLGRKLHYPELKEYLESTGKEHALEMYKGVFHVRLYEDDRIIHSRELELDDNLVLRSKKELDERKVYRVVLYTAYELNGLYDLSIKRLLEHPNILKRVVAVAYRAGYIPRHVYEGVVGVMGKDLDGNDVWLNGISTIQGFRWLFRVIADIPPHRLEYRNSSWTPRDNDPFDSIYKCTGGPMTGFDGTLSMRNLQMSYVEATNLDHSLPEFSRCESLIF